MNLIGTRGLSGNTDVVVAPAIPRNYSWGFVVLSQIFMQTGPPFDSKAARLHVRSVASPNHRASGNNRGPRENLLRTSRLLAAANWKGIGVRPVPLNPNKGLSGAPVGKAKAPGCDRYPSRDYCKQRTSRQNTFTRTELEGMPLVTVWKSYIPRAWTADRNGCTRN